MSAHFGHLGTQSGACYDKNGEKKRRRGEVWLTGKKGGLDGEEEDLGGTRDIVIPMWGKTATQIGNTPGRDGSPLFKWIRPFCRVQRNTMKLNSVALSLADISLIFYFSLHVKEPLFWRAERKRRSFWGEEKAYYGWGERSRFTKKRSNCLSAP